MLVEAKADIHAQTNAKSGTLHWAARGGHAAVVATLIQAKAHIHVQNKKLWCALDMAADKDKKGSHEACIAVLREHGAKHSLKYAASRGLAEEAAACIAEGVDVDAPDDLGLTAVDAAESNGHTQLVALLRKHGAHKGSELKERVQNAWRDAGKVVVRDHVSVGKGLHQDYTLAFGKFSTFQADVKLSGGRFYYEVEIEEMQGVAQLGWATEGFHSTPEDTGEGVGDNPFSWGFDGTRKLKWSDDTSTAFGDKWNVGDVLGLACDMVNKTVSFSVNGSFESPFGVAFERIAAEWIAPTLTADSGFQVVANFGARPFKHAPPDEAYVSVQTAIESEECLQVT